MGFRKVILDGTCKVEVNELGVCIGAEDTDERDVYLANTKEELIEVIDALNEALKYYKNGH